MSYEFHVLLDGAYPHVPYAGKRKSNYVDLPNAHYDRVLGQRALEDQLETLAALEALGYDGAMVSEQHNGPIGLLGNPMLAGAWLAARTRSIKIGVVGPIINAYATPLRLAEEIATVDTMSGGRLIVGLPLGHGMQHHSIGVIDPTRARARYREAHELLVRAFTHPGPFEWHGEFFQIPYVNLWPKPLQEPHPPFFVPGGGSAETLELVARHRYTYQAVLNPRPVLVRNVQRFRELCRREGYEADPRQIAAVIAVHVAETDRQARLETEAHELWQYQNFFRSPLHDNLPPGYTSVRSVRGMLGGGYRSRSMSEYSYDELVDNGWVIAGSPETVTERLRELLEELGAGRVILGMNAGSKPRWLAMKSLTLFAEEVIPRLRRGGVPAWQQERLPGYATASEYGARVPRDAPRPLVQLGGAGLQDVRTAHVEELRGAVEPWPPAA